MANEQDGITDEEKNKKLANGVRDILIERIDGKTINASEMKVAMELLEKLGYRYVSPSIKPAGSRPLPVLEDDEEDLVDLGNGVTVRQTR